MYHAPGLATSLAMQAYLRHHGTPVCLHELLAQTVRQRCKRAGADAPFTTSTTSATPNGAAGRRVAGAVPPAR